MEIDTSLEYVLHDIIAFDVEQRRCWCARSYLQRLVKKVDIHIYWIEFLQSFLVPGLNVKLLHMCKGINSTTICLGFFPIFRTKLLSGEQEVLCNVVTH